MYNIVLIPFENNADISDNIFKISVTQREIIVSTEFTNSLFSLVQYIFSSLGCRTLSSERFNIYISGTALGIEKLWKYLCHIIFTLVI
jgi:hypothetical protein